MNSPSKCYIVIRNDLDMPEGKFGAQIGHGIDAVWKEVLVAGTMVRAANIANEQPKERDIKIQDEISKWVSDGSRKIILKTKSEDELLKIYKKVLSEGYICTKIYDYGFNFFDGLTLTGIVVHPCSEEIKTLKRVRLW